MCTRHKPTPTSNIEPTPKEGNPNYNPDTLTKALETTLAAE